MFFFSLIFIGKRKMNLQDLEKELMVARGQEMEERDRKFEINMLFLSL